MDLERNRMNVIILNKNHCDSMKIKYLHTWNDSAGSDDLLDVVFNILIRYGSSLFLDELEEPLEHFLVSKSVKGTSKTVNTSRVGEIRVRKSRSNEMS